METKASLKDSTCNATSNTQLSENLVEAMRTGNCDPDELLAILKKIRQASIDWELGLEKKFNVEECLSIIGMVSYLENQANGFGKRNDEALFKSESALLSTSGLSLLAEANVGFSLARDCAEAKKLHPRLYMRAASPRSVRLLKSESRRGRSVTVVDARSEKKKRKANDA